MVKLLCDLHVHLYDIATARQRIERTAQIVQSRYSNYDGMVMVVTKSARENFFDETQKSGLLKNTGLEKSPFPVFLFYASQVVTQENLEVHLYGDHTFEDKRAKLFEILTWAKNNNIRAGLPWGFGKWMGARGTLIEAALREFDVKLVDSALRFHPSPIFSNVKYQGRILYGTDPLPIQEDEQRIGELCSEYKASQLPKNFLELFQGLQMNTPKGHYLPLVIGIKKQLQIRL